MIDLDFVEIGSCDHDTLLDSATANTTGIVIEPIKIYLDRLPDLPGVTKLNIAISPDNITGEVDIYYVPPEIIESNPEYHLTLKGCNQIGGIHQQHVLWHLEQYVVSTKVKIVPLPAVLEQHGVRGIKHLKIDIEGGDSMLLKNFVSYLNTKSKDYYPEQITFETNKLTPVELVDEVIQIYQQLGYRVVDRDFNTILKLYV